MPKFLANLRVIIEAEDWSEAFDYLDELVKPGDHPILSSMDTVVKASSIDTLASTRRSQLAEGRPRHRGRQIR